MAGCCECGDEPSGSGATELVNRSQDCTVLQNRKHQKMLFTLDMTVQQQLKNKTVFI
jgi:hypothetical protein